MAPRASESLGNFWKPSATLGPQSVSGALLSLLPLTTKSPWPPGASESLDTFQKPSMALGLSETTGTCSSHPLSLPGPLGPQKAFGTFESLWQLWGLSQVSGSLVPLLTLTP